MNNKLTLIKNDIPTNIPSYLFAIKLVMPSQLNPGGTLFGGEMMAWMDKISAMLAQRIAKGNVVTASVSEINFENPVKNGDQVELSALLLRLGNSSVQIKVNALVHKLDGEEVPVANAIFNFVHLDRNGKPCYISR